MQVTADTGTELGHPVPAQHRRRVRLCPLLDRDLGRAVDDGVDRHRRPECRVDHRDANGAVQIVAVTDEHLVLLLHDFHVEIACGAATRPDLALRGQPDAHAVADADRDLHRDVPTRTHPAVAAALAAGVRDGLACTAAGGARTAGHDLAEERALHRLHFAGTATGLAPNGLGIAVGARAGAQVAQDRRVDGDVLGDAGGAFVEGEFGSQQRIGSGLYASLGSALSTACAAAEERFEDVAEAAPESGTAESAATTAAALLQRIAAEVDDSTLLRIGEHLVCGGNVLEPGLCGLVRVHVRVQLSRQFAVRAFDLLVRSLLADAQSPVIIPCHVVSFVLEDESRSLMLCRGRCAPAADDGSSARVSARPGPRRCTWQPPRPTRLFLDSPFGWGRERPSLPGPCQQSRIRWKSPMFRASPRPASPRRYAR